MLAQFARVNELENLLEVQQEDAELISIRKSLEADLQKTSEAFKKGNEDIKRKLGTMPDSAKVVNDKDYGDQMQFVLKH